MTRPVLLMTRPEPASRAFLHALPAQLRARLNVCVSPLMRIEGAGTAVDLTAVKGVIFSSTHAARLIPAPLPSFRAYCVGRATRAAAQESGWDARFCGHNAAELIETLDTSPSPGPLLHLSGRHIAVDIVGALRARGMRARRLVVYEQRAMEATDEARMVLRGPGPVIVPLFSQRSARLFAHLVEDAAALYIVAMSDAISKQIKARFDCAALRVARTADSAAMVDAIAELCQEVRGSQG